MEDDFALRYARICPDVNSRAELVTLGLAYALGISTPRPGTALRAPGSGKIAHDCTQDHSLSDNQSLKCVVPNRTNIELFFYFDYGLHCDGCFYMQKYNFPRLVFKTYKHGRILSSFSSWHVEIQD